MATETDTRDRTLKVIFDQLAGDRSLIVETATLEALGADSIDLVEIIMALKEEFGIEIGDDELTAAVDTALPHGITVGDVLKLVTAKAAEHA